MEEEKQEHPSLYSQDLIGCINDIHLESIVCCVTNGNMLRVSLHLHHVYRDIYTEDAVSH